MVVKFDQKLHEAKVSDVMRHKILVSLSSLLRVAMLEGHVNRNVADRYRVEVDKRAKRKVKVGVDIPSKEEVGRFLAVLEDPWRPLFMTAAFTGMRASELRGLRWDNVRFFKNSKGREVGEINVRERADMYHQIGSPKSVAGERTIPFGPQLANTLRRWRLVCPKGELNLVFPTRTGKVQSLSNIIRRGLIPLMKKAGIVDKHGKVKYGGMHSFRHFYASLLINPKDQGGHGLPAQEVQKRLGHSTLAMTMDTYSHLFPRGDDADQMRDVELSVLG